MQNNNYLLTRRALFFNSLPLFRDTSLVDTTQERTRPPQTLLLLSQTLGVSLVSPASDTPLTKPLLLLQLPQLDQSSLALVTPLERWEEPNL